MTHRNFAAAATASSRHLVRSACLIGVVASLGLPSPARAGDGGKVAVLDVQTTNVDPKLVAILTEILAVEVQGLGRYESVIAGRDIAAIMGFEKQRDLVGCGDTECLVEIGGALGVDRLVVGHVGKVGHTFVVNIKLISIVDARTEQRIYQTVKGEEDVLIASIRDSVHKLVPDRKPQPAVAARAPSAASPAAPPAPPLAAPPIAPSAPSAPNAPASSGGIGATPWVLWGVGLAGVGAGVGFGLKVKGHLDRSESGAAGSQLEIADGETSQLLANIGFGVGAASLIGGLVVALVSGGDDATEAPITTVAPAVHAAGGGLSLIHSF